MAEKLLSMQHAADELNVSVKTIRRWIESRKLTGYLIGRLIRVNADEIAELKVSRKLPFYEKAKDSQPTIIEG